MRSCQASEPEVSATLLAAQERLQAIRRQLNIEPGAHRSAAGEARPSAVQDNWLLRNAQEELQRRRAQAGSTTARAQKEYPAERETHVSVTGKTTPVQAEKLPESVIVYPSLLLAMMKSNQEAAGRVYLLLRYLDKDGRGCLEVAGIRDKLTRKGSPLKVMGWRRLRQLFHQGEGVFWERDSQGRLWLRSAAKIALNLDCERLKGKRVALPLNTLLGGIGTVRAHFYASFHAGCHSSNPISRETLQSVTGLSPRTQRAYDRLAHISRQQNIAVGPRHSPIAAEEQSWQRGRAVFTFVDSQGKRGPKNRHYVAWCLPNSYHAPHQQRSKGRQKKINQQLASLVENGVQGTGQAAVEKLFWKDGAAAGKAYGRDRRLDAYWPRGAAQRRPGVIWYVLVRQVQ